MGTSVIAPQIDPATGDRVKAVAAPQIDPATGDRVLPTSLSPDEADRATDALVYSNMTGAPPSVTYDHRDELNKGLANRLEGYAAAGWKGLWHDSIIAERLRGQISGPFENDDDVSKFVEGLGQMVGDLPVYAAGAVAGSIAGATAGTAELPVVGTISGAAVGGAAGSFGLTAGLRQWLVDKYAGKKISAFDEVLDVMKQSGKGMLTGAAFGAAGEAAPLAEGMVGKFLGPRAYKAAAELATMTTVGSALEGKVPTAGDFARNAALLGLMHVTLGGLELAKKSLPDLQAKTMDIYAREGTHPADVVSEAGQRSVVEPPTDNPMEILNKIDNELARVSGEPGEETPAEEAPKEETPTEPPAPADRKETSIKNETVKAERAQRGLSEVEVEARQVPAFDAAKEAVDSGKIDPRQLAEELANNPRPHTDEEAAALLYDRMRLQNEHAAAMSTIEQARATGDEAAEARGKERLKQVEDATNSNDEAARLSGTETGRALSARRMMIKQDYSLSNVLQRARVASADGEVSPEVRNRLEILTGQLDEANKRIGDYEESKKQQAAQQMVDKLQREKQRGERAGKRMATKEHLATEYGSLLKDLNAELMGKLSANPMLNPKLYELFGKLAVNRIHSGLTTIEQIVDDLHSQLQERGISKREIRDYISGYGRQVKEPDKNEVQAQLREAKKQGKLISAIEDAEAGEQPEKGKPPGKPSERVKELRKELDAAMMKAGLIEEKVPSQDTSLKSYKTRTAKRIADLQRQLDTGDYAKPTRKQTILDQQAEDLKAHAEKLKSQVDDQIAKQKWEGKGRVEKGAAIFQKWRRGILISSVSVGGKIVNSSMQRFGITPIEELIGGALSKMPGIAAIADKAPREGGGLNISAEVKAFAEIFSSATAKDSWEKLKTGKSSLDYNYGKKGGQPPMLVDFVGHIHGALQTPAMRAEFSRSVEIIGQWSLDHGQDIQDPRVQATITADAYLSAQRAVFQQDNFVSTAFRMTVNYLKTQGLSAKSTAFMLETVLPIVKIPTNIIGESITYTTGSVTGSIKALKYILDKNALKGLKGNEADNILRALKKGQVGLALLAMGYYAGQSGPGLVRSSGFYQPADAKDKPTPQSFSIGGVELPTWLIDTPPGLVFQVGATVRRVNDYYAVKGRSGGLVAGVVGGALGLAKKIPFTGAVTDTAQALQNPDTAGLFIDDLIQSLVVPPDIRKLAKMGDTNDVGKEIKRKPTDLRETLEQNIPELRGNVPAVNPKRRLKRRFSIRRGSR